MPLSDDSAILRVNIFDGTREPIGSDVEVSITVDNGIPERVVDHRAAKGPSGPDHSFKVDYFNGIGDRYTVLVNAHGYKDGGCRIKVSDKAPTDANVMLLPRKGTFKFPSGDWQTLRQTHPDLATLLTEGVSDETAQQRYNKRMHEEPAILAGFFNITTSLSKIRWPEKTALDYLKELIWDEMTQDRLYAWADSDMIRQATEAGERKEFDVEPGIIREIFHHGSKLSYKQTQFGEADVQITFHEQAKRNIGGVEVDCVKVEPDIDYYKDIIAHGLGEVLPNAIAKAVGEGGLTDPEKVYLLRWTAAQQAGLDFDPPYIISV